MSLFVPINSGPNVAIAECPRCHRHLQYVDLVQDPNNLNWMCKLCRDDFDPWRLPPRRTEDISLAHARPDPHDYSTQVPPTLILARSDVSNNLSLNGLTATHLGSDAVWGNYRANDAITFGKWYWEMQSTGASVGGTHAMIGVASAPVANMAFVGADANGWGWEAFGNTFHNGASTPYGSPYTIGDIVGAALDMDKRILTFLKNNQTLGVAFSNLPSSVYLAGGLYNAFSTQTMNFGSVSLAFPPPPGFSPVFNVASAYPYPANTQVEEGVL